MITAAQELLGWAVVRLLTLTGAPGAGKSRLAHVAASGLPYAILDGIFFAARSNRRTTLGHIPADL